MFPPLRIAAHTVSKLWLKPFLGFWLFVFPSFEAISVEPAGWDFPQTGRIVVFSDVHGAYSELLALLQQTGVIDGDANWSGGTTQLVSLGDLFDRGPDSRKVIELLMRLEKQAPLQKGSVHVVLGNHEVMLATGDMRYVSAAEYESYAHEETIEEREALYQQFIEVRSTQSPPILRADFDRFFPAGFIALSRSHGMEGEIGQWLLAQPLILKIGDNLFLHGGVSPKLTGYQLQDINQQEKQAIVEYIDLVTSLTEQGVLNPTIGYFQRELQLSQRLIQYRQKHGRRSTPEWEKQAERLTELLQSIALSDSGPTWYRGTALCHSYVESYDVERILDRWNARRIVIGHTPTVNRRVVSRMNGTVIMADTGMLNEYYKGRAAAVVINNDINNNIDNPTDNNEVSVVYAGETGLQPPVLEQRVVPRQPSGFTDAELEEFLLTAEIIANEAIGTGVTKPRKLTLRQGDVTLDAVYKNFDSHPNLQTRKSYIRRQHDKSDRYVYDIATYKLDRLLNINMVPVSVERDVDGKLGVVTLWLQNTINERDRQEQQELFSGLCPQYHQYRMRFIFDVLIHNDDRNLTNILWTNDTYELLFIDHSRAFRSSAKKPDQLKEQSMYLSELFREKLLDLNLENLTHELEDYLHPSQIGAILDRRDLILEQARSTNYRPR